VIDRAQERYPLQALFIGFSGSSLNFLQ